MATLTAADVMSDINSLLLLFSVDKSDQQPPTLNRKLAPIPLPILAPAPQRPPSDFATVLGWRETEDDPLLSDTEPLAPTSNNAYLKCGGAYTQRVLAAGRVVARYADDVGYAHALTNAANANQAPPWPPAPELIANPPNWGLSPQSECAVAPHSPSPAVDAVDMNETMEPSDDGWSSYAPSRASVASRFTEAQEEWEWETASASACDASDDGCDTGYFVGRDGSLWPMPPPECMPGGGLAMHRVEKDAATVERTEPKYLPTDDDLDGEESDEEDAPSNEPECWIVWSAEDASEDDEDGPYTSPPPLSAGSPASSASSQEPLTPPASPCSDTLADLGRQWYASFGKDLPVPFSVPQQHRDSSTTRPAPRESRAVTEYGPRTPFIGVEVPTDTRTGLVRGRDGLLWPVPPPPPDPWT